MLKVQGISRAATFGDDRRYRYQLIRSWGRIVSRIVVFIMLNPSTADALQDDPTVRRCIDFAKRWGFDSLYVVNLFALRATDPAALYKDDAPIGPRNDEMILDAVKRSELTVCAWGNHGVLHDRNRAVLELIDGACVPHYLRINDATGEPSHPLYLKKTLKPEPYAWRT